MYASILGPIDLLYKTEDCRPKLQLHTLTKIPVFDRFIKFYKNNTLCITRFSIIYENAKYGFMVRKINCVYQMQNMVSWSKRSTVYTSVQFQMNTKIYFLHLKDITYTFILFDWSWWKLIKISTQSCTVFKRYSLARQSNVVQCTRIQRRCITGCWA